MKAIKTTLSHCHNQWRHCYDSPFFLGYK